MSNPNFRVTKYNHIECNKEKQPALHIDILNGLKASMQQSHLCPWKTTEKRLDFVQRGVNEEMPPYSYKTPRKRKPADKISFTIRGLGIVIRGDWLWQAANISDKNNSAAVYVQSMHRERAQSFVFCWQIVTE